VAGLIFPVALGPRVCEARLGAAGLRFRRGPIASIVTRRRMSVDEVGEADSSTAARTVDRAHEPPDRRGSCARNVLDASGILLFFRLPTLSL